MSELDRAKRKEARLRNKFNRLRNPDSEKGRRLSAKLKELRDRIEAFHMASDRPFGVRGKRMLPPARSA